MLNSFSPSAVLTFAFDAEVRRPISHSDKNRLSFSCAFCGLRVFPVQCCNYDEETLTSNDLEALPTVPQVPARGGQLSAQVAWKDQDEEHSNRRCRSYEVVMSGRKRNKTRPAVGRRSICA